MKADRTATSTSTLQLGKTSLLMLILAVFAFALITSGTWIARRDPSVDATLLHIARSAQLIVYFLAAFMFRNHLPMVKRIFTIALIGLLLHLGLNGLLLGGLLDGTGEMTIGAISSVLSGISSGCVTLLAAHVISSYAPRYSVPAFVIAYLVTEAAFALSIYVSDSLVSVLQPALKLSGFIALFVCMKHKENIGASILENPLQYGIKYEVDSNEKPLRFLVSGTDWTFQLIIAAFVPFMFGFMSQLLSADGMSSSLHDWDSEVAAIIALSLLVAYSLMRGRKFGLNDLLLIVVPLYATGLLLLPLLWGREILIGSAFIKCGLVTYQAIIWALLARKAFEDPRHTYLYFGVFGGFANVTYGRILEPVLLNGQTPNATILSTVSLMFFWALTIIVLLLFLLQREISDSKGSRELQPVDPFVRGINVLSEQCKLTPREKEVLIEMLHGYSMSNTAKKLFISPETVRSHMKNIYKKTSTGSKQSLIAAIDEIDKDE